jgi:hypothetical protein
VNVSTNGHWGLDGLHVRFIDENLLGLLTESLDVFFRERFAL